MGRLARRNLAPSPTEFWRTVALPRAQRLVDSARAGIGSGAAFTGAAPGPEAVGTIDELGRWWLQRLRRAAALRALPQLALCPVEEVPRQLARHELRLLSQAPWSHGDLLLSAFELAHREIAYLHRRSAIPPTSPPRTAPASVPHLDRTLTLR